VYLLRTVCITVLLITTLGFTEAQAIAHVEGNIVDSKGLGLGGASVHFLLESRGVRITVITDRKGRFAVDLPSGTFRVDAEARGYAAAEVERPLAVGSGDRQEVHVTLHRLEDPLALEAQINGAELLSAIPTHERREFIHRCVGCHSLEVAAGRRMPEEAWAAIGRRMSGQHPTLKGIMGPLLPWKRASWDEAIGKLAKFFGPTAGHLDYKTFPIANDLEHLSKVVIKEFELPRPEIYTHDVAADPLQDRIWYGDQAADKVDAIGKFGWYDPATGKSGEYEVPQCRGFTRAFTEKRSGRVWVGCDYALAYWDPKTDKSVILPLDLGENAMHGLAFDSDGNVWLPVLSKTGHAGEDEYDYIGKFDLRTSKLTKYKIPTPLSGPYEVRVDSQDNVWFTEIIADKIGKLNPETGKFTEYPTPTPDSAPRRFDIDSKDNIWFVEYFAGKLGMLDSKTGQIHEYEIPTPLSFPYACSVDRNDIVWFSEITGNRIGRFDPETKTFREYPIPSRLSGIKKLDFSYLEDRQIVWGGYRVGATVVRFEIPLD
jgi:virginiamycin B lyase